MEYILTTNDRDAIEWMEGMLANTIANKGHRAALVAYPHIQEWLRMFDDARKKKSNSDVLVPLKTVDEEEDKPKRRVAKKSVATNDTKPKAKKIPVDKSGLTCNHHPTYQGKRTPRTDCASCWKVYKKFHPEEYDVKRRSFLAKRRQANSQ